MTLITVTQKNLARAMNLSVRRMTQLVQERVVIKDEGDPTGGVYLFASVMNYYSSKHSGDAGGANFWREKAEHEKVKREINEVKLKQLEASVYPAELVESTFAEMLTILRNNLLGLPSKLAAQLENKSREEIFTLLEEEMEANLENLSEYGGKIHELAGENTEVPEADPQGERE